MKVIAEANGSPIFETDNLLGYSLFNSPYYSHQNLEAIDLIPDGDFGDEALSPVEGIVEKILKFKIPSVTTFFKVMDLESRDFKKTDYEYVILIRDKYNKKNIFKILHLAPKIKEGEKVHVNDVLGYYIRTGYYSFWASCHIHLEVKDERNPLRVKKGYKIRPKVDIKRVHDNFTHKTYLGIERKILKRTDSYIEIEGFYRGSYVYGKYGRNKTCILDGGIPHMGYGGIISNENIEIGEDVYFLGIKIGKIFKTFGKIAIFKPCVKIFLNNIPMRGISFIINLKGKNKNRIVFIRRENSFINSDRVYLEILSV